MRLILSVLVLLTTFPVLGQNAYLKRDLLVNAGVGLIQYRIQGFEQSERAGKALPVFVSAEYGVHPMFSAGVYAGYYSREYRFLGRTGSDSLNNPMFSSRYLSVGVKGSMHVSKWLEDKLDWNFYSEDLDLYTSVLLGYEFNMLYNPSEYPLDNKSRPAIGLIVGARYYLNYRVALFAEAGPGIFGLGSLGVTTRF